MKKIILIIFFTFMPLMCFSEIIDIKKLAEAIRKSENSKTHPYGILAHYKHTSPRQACINTIKHALKDWNGQGDFITFLGNRYCPIGAKNDPTGLNRHWVKNVKYHYNHQSSKSGRTTSAEGDVGTSHLVGYKKEAQR